MISFALEEEQLVARDMATNFANQLLRPASRGADEKNKLDPEILDQLWGLGLLEMRTSDPNPVTNALTEPGEIQRLIIARELLGYGGRELN